MTVVQHLVVDEFGAHLGKYNERLKVTKKGETLAQAPLLYLESVTVANSGVSISAEAVRECTERGIPIYFISSSGTPYASLYSSGLGGTVATRRAQLIAYSNSLGLRAAINFGKGKLQNQVNLIKYIAKYRKETDPELYQELRMRADEILDELIDLERILSYPEVMEGSCTLDDLRNEILGHEGLGAKKYWGTIRLVLPEKYAFMGRTGRGAKDPINAALNYGYGILYGQCERCLTLAGLDPYAGFLHADRPGKPSLTLDFIEEFRQAVVDRAIIGMANKGTALEQDEQGLLTKETRRLLAGKVQERLEAETSYQGKRFPLRVIMQMQARKLAAFLRVDRAEYETFVMSW